jgi:predicted anti-sigma-YlaC factor YlaD
MNCEEYRKQFHLIWRPREFPTPTAEMQLHLQACDSCRAYTESMRKLHATLIRWPEPEMPPGLERTLLAMAEAAEERERNILWKPYAIRTTILVLPVVALYVALWSLPISIQFWINLLIPCFGIGISLFLRTRSKTVIPTTN